MVSLAAMFVWRISPWLVFLPWLTIACLDGVYLSSALVKVPDGAWFTLTLSGVLTCLFILWRFGKEQQWAAEAADRFPTTHFLKKSPPSSPDGNNSSNTTPMIHLTDRFGGSPVSTVNGFGIFFDKDGTTVPPVFSQFVLKLLAAPQVMVLFHLRPLETPSVPVEERYTVSRLAIPHCYRLVVRHGYSDEVINADLAALIYEQVRAFIIHDGGVSSSAAAPALLDPPADERTQDPTTTTTTTSPTTDFPTSPTTTAPTPQIALHTVPTNEKPPQPSPSSPKYHSTPSTATALAKLDEAYAHQILYIIGKAQLHVRSIATGRKFSIKETARNVLLRCFLWLRENTRTKIASLRVPMDRVFEVGFVKDI